MVVGSSPILVEIILSLTFLIVGIHPTLYEIVYMNMVYGYQTRPLTAGQRLDSVCLAEDFAVARCPDMYLD